MKKTIVTLLGLLMAVTVSQPVFAAEPDSPGSKMITIQAGGLPGFGGLVSAQIAMANVGKGHLYGGLQLGGNYRHGAALGSKKLDLSLAPRVLYGFRRDSLRLEGHNRGRRRKRVLNKRNIFIDNNLHQYLMLSMSSLQNNLRKRRFLNSPMRK